MTTSLKPLKGVRIVSLALNVPGPAALQRCKALGAQCSKIEAPPPAGHGSSDPMQLYSPRGYADLQQGMKVQRLDLKTPQGQARLHRLLAMADVCITSFRQSAMQRLGVDWKTLHRQHPQLSLVAIYGSTANPDEAGHDLTYQAQNGLITGLSLPPALFADMAGALMATEAVLQCVLQQRARGKGVRVEVGLSQAVAFLAQPRTAWGMHTLDAPTGGGHAGYRVYACKDGRVALAALEPHFYRRLCAEIGLDASAPDIMQQPATAQAIAAWLAGKTRLQLDRLAADKDIPLETLPR